MHLLALSLSLFISLTLITSAHGEILNARVRGSESWFHSVITAADTLTCREPACPITTRPTTLILRTPTSPHLKVTLVSATLAKPIRAGVGLSSIQTTEGTKGPILLRGFLVVDPRAGLSVPVAALITRSAGFPVLSITAPLPRRAELAASQHLATVHLPLSSLHKLSTQNARSRTPSRFAFPNMRCGVIQQRHSIQASPDRKPDQGVTTQATYPTLYIATDYDPLFANRIRCTSAAACNDAILKTLHSSAVFYEEQLGYTLTVARQFGPTSISSTTVPSKVLDSAQQLSLMPRFSLLHTGTNLAENQIDLFHYFTGRTMDNKTIGIAYVGTACKNGQSEFSQAVIQHVSNELNPVIVAHETGHTLNALHTTSGIMRPNLSGNTPKSFSSASLLAISGHLDTWYRECRQGTVEGSATPTPTPTPRGGGSSSSNPHTGKPVTVQLTVVSSAPTTVSLSTTVTSLVENCSIRIRAGTSSFRALRGAIFAEFAPTELSTTKIGKARFRVRPSDSTKANIYFVAEHSCADGTILEVSRVRRFNANRVRGVSRTQRSKRSWLQVLRESIQ